MSNNDYNLRRREDFADPSPYPEIKVAEPNLYYAELLMDDYAGVVSEFTAISQYLYHYFVLKRRHEDLGEMLENIAITEMRHMEILADTIVLLGGEPHNPRVFQHRKKVLERPFRILRNRIVRKTPGEP